MTNDAISPEGTVTLRHGVKHTPEPEPMPTTGLAGDEDLVEAAAKAFFWTLGEFAPSERRELAVKMLLAVDEELYRKAKLVTLDELDG